VTARYEHGEHHFEVLIDPYDAQKLKNGEEVDLEKALAIDEVFKDAKKGDRASDVTVKKVFGTTDVLVIARRIVMEGEIQLTTDQRRKMTEEKRKQIVTYIARNAINPLAKAPHPPQRIENAMAEARVHIDPFKSVESQVKGVLDAIKVLIPIRIEKATLAVKLTAEQYGRVYRDITDFGQIKKEEWTGGGDWIGLVELPAGMQGEFQERLGKKTHGDVQTRRVD
jgi:ribosome maturation protein SDO1